MAKQLIQTGAAPRPAGPYSQGLRAGDFIYTAGQVPINPSTGKLAGETIEITAQFCKELGLEELVRFEHHVTETWKGLVIQPYLQRQQVVDLAGHAPIYPPSMKATIHRSKPAVRGPLKSKIIIA